MALEINNPGWSMHLSHLEANPPLMGQARELITMDGAWMSYLLAGNNGRNRFRVKNRDENSERLSKVAISAGSTRGANHGRNHGKEGRKVMRMKATGAHARIK